MHQGSSNYPKFQIHEKALSTTEMVCGLWKLSGARKRDQSLFSLLLEIESRLRAEGRNDQIEQRKRSKEKDRQHSSANKLSVIASSRETINEERKSIRNSENLAAGSICNQYDPGYNRKILATYRVQVPSLWNKLK
jgi:hypothetical protein